METLEAFALYLPTGLYVILIELLVLGMALGILPSLREQRWGILWEAGFVVLGVRRPRPPLFAHAVGGGRLWPRGGGGGDALSAGDAVAAL